jgi:hypothetical protein
MGILDHEQEPAATRQPHEQTEKGLEQPCLPRIAAHVIALDWLGGSTQVGQEPGEFRAGRAQELVQFVRRTSDCEHSQRLGERCKRQARPTEFDAGSDERNLAALASSADDLLDETGLADAGLAGDEKKT